MCGCVNYWILDDDASSSREVLDFNIVYRDLWFFLVGLFFCYWELLLRAESEQLGLAGASSKDSVLFPGLLWCNQFSESSPKWARVIAQLSIVPDSSWRQCMNFCWSIMTLIIFQNSDSMYEFILCTSFSTLLLLMICCLVS